MIQHGQFLNGVNNLN